MILQVEGLVKRYAAHAGTFRRGLNKTAAVDDVSFGVAEGETLGLVGGSGCGKTTLARCILNLIPPDSGTVRFHGQNLLDLSERQMRTVRRNLQIIFQDPTGSLNPRMTVGAIVEEPLIIHGFGKTLQRRARVRELFEMVGLDPEWMRRYPHEFSGGQKQRVAIARALALQPKFIVADEPVSSLDVTVAGQILDLLKRLQKQFHLSFLFISHDLSVVQLFCNRIAVMHAGKIVEIADNVDLFKHPQHPYTKLLLASIPSLP